MSNPTLQSIKDRFAAVRDKIGFERQQIIELQSNPREYQGKVATDFNRELRDLKQEEKKYNQDFREQQAILNSTGGKSRNQTLQEFVLLFFYIGFALLSVSLSIFAYVQGVPSAIVKVLGASIFIGLLVTGLIIRYA